MSKLVVVPPKTIVHRFPAVAAATQPHTKKRKKVIFLGGNGFSALCFQPLLENISSHGIDVDALELLPMNLTRRNTPQQRPPSPAEHFQSATTFTGFPGIADDILRYLETERPEAERNDPVSFAGWSMGATAAVMAAARRPELFQGGITLIDTANLSPWWRPIHHNIPNSLRSQLVQNFEPVKSTLKKRSTWSSREDFEEKWLAKTRLLRKMKNPELHKRFLKQRMVEEIGESRAVQLSFDPAWEAWYFSKPDNLRSSLKQLRVEERQKKINVPIMAICAAPSIFSSESLHQFMRDNLVDVHVFKQYSHMLPIEDPVLCGDLIGNFVR